MRTLDKTDIPVPTRAAPPAITPIRTFGPDRENSFDPAQTALMRAIAAHREIHLEGLRTWAITEFSIAMRKAAEFNAKQS